MKTIEEIGAEFEADTVIDQRYLDKESIRVPSLIAKWSTELARHVQAANEKRLELQKLYLYKELFYMKKLPGEVYKKTPMPHTIDSRTGAKTWIEADSEYQKLQRIINDHDVCIDRITNGMQELHNRSFTIKNIIAWHSYQNGAN